MGGVQPKNYGSVFIYKNGFRINPYGEPGQDFFGIDQRKAQGWKRFLGTREIMGRISIKGRDPEYHAGSFKPPSYHGKLRGGQGGCL